VRTISTAFLAGGWAAGAFAALRRLGIVGVFLLGVADSSFLFFPFGNDLLLISLVASNREGLAWVGYVVAGAAGSVVGVAIVDAIMRRVGEEGLGNFVGEKTLARVRRRIEGHAWIAVFVATLAPPPFPFTAVVMTASALHTPRLPLLAAVFCGRLVRFTIEALLALRFGTRIVAWLESDTVEYAVWGFVAVAAVGTFFSLRKWLRRGRKGSGVRDQGAGPEPESSFLTPGP
jgi:membrane protein YqaA with SNARE-associated domain